MARKSEGIWDEGNGSSGLEGNSCPVPIAIVRRWSPESRAGTARGLSGSSEFTDGGGGGRTTWDLAIV